jgi:hypothetical protein
MKYTRYICNSYFRHKLKNVVMKKLTLLLCASMGLLGMSRSSAQIQQGNLLVGATLGDLKLGLQSGNTSFSIAVSPKIGYFIKDNIVVGAMVNLGFSTDHYSNVFDYGVGAFGRYYFGQKENMVIMQHARFFVEGNVGITGQNSDQKGSSAGSVSTNGLGLGIGPGVAYFITPNIGLEALLKYDLGVGFGNATTSNNFGINVGFQIYLPSKKARAIYNDAAQEVKEKKKKGEG